MVHTTCENLWSLGKTSTWRCRWEDHFGLTVTFADPKEADVGVPNPEDSQIKGGRNHEIETRRDVDLDHV